MRRLLVIAAAVAVVTPGLRAQEPAGPDSVRAEWLRREIENRFARRVQLDLGLSDEQIRKLRATHEQFFPQRRAIVRDQREVRLALQQQLRPGEPADADSVRKLNEAMLTNRRRAFELEQEEEREMGRYLTPVQLVRYRQMREAFFQRVQEVQRRRGGVLRPGNEPPRQGPRPAERPRRRPRG